jgi:hypothetical protein
MSDGVSSESARLARNAVMLRRKTLTVVGRLGPPFQPRLSSRRTTPLPRRSKRMLFCSSSRMPSRPARPVRHTVVSRILDTLLLVEMRRETAVLGQAAVS